MFPLTLKNPLLSLQRSPLFQNPVSKLQNLAALVSKKYALPALNASSPTWGLSVRQNIPYGPLSRHQLDLYIPQDATNAPMVVFVHGGVWSWGSKEDYKFVGESLARSGIVTAVINYRLAPEVVYPAFIDDTILAMRWAVSNAEMFGVNSEQIFLMGHSAGAFNIVDAIVSEEKLEMCGLKASQFAGIIAVAGPYDFDQTIEEIAHIFKGSERREVMPVHKVKEGLPPFLMLQAGEDEIIEEGYVMGMVKALEDKSVEVKYVKVEDVNHAHIIGSVASRLGFMAPSVKPTILGFISNPAA
ncbi:MAG: alpha/beta hydrolase [Deinococcaceae bacterium]